MNRDALMGAKDPSISELWYILEWWPAFDLTLRLVCCENAPKY